MNICRVLTSSGLLVALLGPVQAQQTALPNRFDRPANVDAPVVLCIDDKPTAGGKPSPSAYAKAAANGYRSVLTLRSKQDGVELVQERLMVEQNRMRYFNIPVTAKLPAPAQVDEFLALVREKENHPMLINCAYAERVAPYMIAFRIAEQGWSEEKALEEAVRIGVSRDSLKKFARAYFAQRKAKSN